MFLQFYRIFFTFCLFLLLFITTLSAKEALLSDATPLKILHLTFHRGCDKEFKRVAKYFGLDLTTWYLPDLPPRFFDSETEGNTLYNVTQERAERIWQKHCDAFNKFDVIITSDTAPLTRIFLQNGWKKPLIIWICNRFDYADEATSEGLFPDEAYYDLFKAACFSSNVQVVAYTAFEHHYAKSKGIDTGELIITPCALDIDDNKASFMTAIPCNIVKEQTFFLPPYHNEIHFIDLQRHCETLGIKTYCGRYAGDRDLEGFKGIHLPYSWSNLALFENINRGLPYLLPSRKFFLELVQQGNYFHPSLSALVQEDLFDLSEWYSPAHADLFIYFDSWSDLIEKSTALEANYTAFREKIRSRAAAIQKTMLKRWDTLFTWAKKMRAKPQ